MGEVWLARDLKLERRVALKVLPQHFTQDKVRLARFQQEARAASALNHPSVCTIHALGETSDGQQFIAMEYIEGETLRQHLGTHRLSVQLCLDIAVQIASGLAAAHAAGIVHRDLKPENVMLRPDGLVKVLDFGLAKLAPHVAAIAGDNPTQMVVQTDAGTVVGTTAYMSPEQARGLDLDARTDIWSLGVMLYEMVARRRPFAGQSSSDVVAAIDREPLPLARIEPDAPPELHRIVGKTLRKDRDQRYQVMKDLQLDLEALRDDVAVRARSSNVEPELPPIGTPTRVPDPDSATMAPLSSSKYLVAQVARHEVATAFAVLLFTSIAALMWWLGGNRAARTDAQGATSVQRTLTRMTFDEGLQAEPTWSPDGRFIAYSSNRSGNFDIWVQSGTEGNPLRVTSSPAHDWQPDWSPDGSRIVFRSERNGGGLFVVPALGGNERKVSAFGYRPRWSPDGSQILFYGSILRTGFEPTNLYLVALDGKPPQEILPSFIQQFTFPYVRAAWHPDRRRISIWGRHREAGWSLWTVPISEGLPVKSALSTDVEQQMKAAAVTFSDFLWAPSGDAVYFVGESRGVTNLWKVAIEPHSLRWIAGPERLTTSVGLDGDIALTADGTKLAFTARREQSRIWSIPFDAAIGRTTGPGQPVTAASADAVMPALTSDGRRMAFVTRRSGRYELWAKSLDDGRETLLVAADGLARAIPRWSSDGGRKDDLLRLQPDRLLQCMGRQVRSTTRHPSR
jgi:serine/threonine protein kinase